MISTIKSITPLKLTRVLDVYGPLIVPLSNMTTAARATVFRLSCR